MTETLLTLSNPLVGERRPGSVGRPLPGVDAVLDEPDENGIGELLVRGPSVCRGYWGGTPPRRGPARHGLARHGLARHGLVRHGGPGVGSR